MNKKEIKTKLASYREIRMSSVISTNINVTGWAAFQFKCSSITLFPILLPTIVRKAAKKSVARQEMQFSQGREQDQVWAHIVSGGVAAKACLWTVKAPRKDVSVENEWPLS